MNEVNRRKKNDEIEGRAEANCVLGSSLALGEFKRDVNEENENCIWRSDEGYCFASEIAIGPWPEKSHFTF